MPPLHAMVSGPIANARNVKAFRTVLVALPVAARKSNSGYGYTAHRKEAHAALRSPSIWQSHGTIWFQLPGIGDAKLLTPALVSW